MFDFIKVDVQGAELLVLRGGLETLKKATFIQFEGSTVQYNAGGSCFYEVDEFLRSNGFYYYDHSSDLRHPVAFKTHGLGQWDILYVNPASPYLPDKLRDLGPQFCGSDPGKKTTTKGDNGVAQYSYSGDRKHFATWMFGVIVGLFLGMFVKSSGKDNLRKGL